jgi:hypothetical protein
MLNTAPLFYGQGQGAKLREYRCLRILYRIRMNTMSLPVYIDRHHCCNKDMVSVGIHLNFITSMIQPFPFLLFTD